MSLDLDQRQRAMLQEMKVPVWWPSAKPAPASEPERSVVAAPAPIARAARGAAVDQSLPPAAVTASPASAQRAANAPSKVDAMDWSQLREAVQSCSACGLCEGRKAPVFAIDPAPQQADWLIVGEPPDEQEERAGAPFVGPAGKLLDNMLRAVQCERGGQGSAGARLCSVVKCRPAVVRNPGPDELAQCAEFLWREVALSKPRVILAMGRFAAMSLLAKDYPETLQLPFGQLRAKVYQCQGIPVVVTYHPSKLLRAPLEKANAWADLCLARAQLVPPSNT